MMKISSSVIVYCWLIFLVYWFISALKVKRIVERKGWLPSLAYRLPFILGVILLCLGKLPYPLNLKLTSHADWVRAIAGAICICGLFVTIWARWTLAGNWSSSVTFKQGHELIKSGPYRFTRHPIYTGILLMCLASTLEIGRLRSWLGFFFLIVGLWVKLKQEESLMLKHFPDQYPAYKKQVKALVPFVI
jgi:protein-S-isoprenylcysteine O-methyltransferase Ste14